MSPPLRAGLPAMAAMPTPTGMSSRLMTMKFMQRANAATAANATSTSGAGPSSPAAASTPSRHDTPKSHENYGRSTASKRRKTTQTAATVSDTPPPLYDVQAIKTALQEEERKRQELMAKLAAEAGDEHWVIPPETLPEHLRRPPPSPPYVEMSFTDMMALPSDSDHDDVDVATAVGRSSKLMDGSHIRRFNMDRRQKQEKQGATGEEADGGGTSASSDDGESDSSASSSEEQQPSRSREANPPRKRRHSSVTAAHNKKRQERAQEFAAKRRKREVRLNRPGPPSLSRQPVGISSGGKKFPGAKN